MKDARAESAPPTLTALLAGAVLLGAVVSTQFFFQPFVWRHWAADELALGWLELLRDRIVVCGCMACAGRAALHYALPAGHARWQLGGRIGLAVAAGAGAGELLLMALGASTAAADAGALVGRVLRWSVVVAAPALLWLLWQRDLARDAAARHARSERQQIDEQLTRLRLQALRSQIEPHFLFNTLATVRRLLWTDSVQGLRLLDHLSDYVRLSAIAGPSPHHWTVGRELELVRAYLGVVGMRMDGRLVVAWHVDAPAETLQCPPLVLATLVENAVIHGITPSQDGGRIEIHGGLAERRLRLEVADTGVGFRANAGKGIGLANTQARLRALYGADADLQLSVNQPNGVRAVVRLPARSTS